MSDPFIRKLSFGARLSDEDCRALAAAVRNVETIPAHTDLICEGESPSDVHVVLKGFACRYKLLDDGRRQILAWLTPGDCCDLQVSLLNEMDHSIATLSECIVGCTEEVAKAVHHLRKRSELSQILPSVIQINSLENQADVLLRAGLVELFDNPQDLINLIKWRDIYTEMEQATDKAEDIADVLRGLSIKHA